MNGENNSADWWTQTRYVFCEVGADVSNRHVTEHIALRSVTTQNGIWRLLLVTAEQTTCMRGRAGFLVTTDSDSELKSAGRLQQVHVLRGRRPLGEGTVPWFAGRVGRRLLTRTCFRTCEPNYFVNHLKSGIHTKVCVETTPRLHYRD
jgi:hypothetical protein